MLKAIKIHLDPTKAQKEALAFQFGAVRWVYNWALNWRSNAYKENGERISKNQIKAELVFLKKTPETAWLKQADSQALQQSTLNLDIAFQRFFKRLGHYPRFKSRHGKQTISYPQRVKIVENKALYLPKIGNVRALFHRKIIGKIKTVTVSKDKTGAYFASILCEDGKSVPDSIKSFSENAITGIDVGIKTLATQSNGQKTANPKFLMHALKNLKHAQKTLSRKQKGSANRDKARVIVAKLHKKVANARNDLQHKLSRQLIDENQAVCVETLKVKNMQKNRKLSRQISDAGWGELIRKIEYKAVWEGKHIAKIDQWYPSSKTCSCCGTKVKSLPLNIRYWTCKICGSMHDRDINAAKNIKQQGIIKLRAEGLSVLDCESNSICRGTV